MSVPPPPVHTKVAARFAALAVKLLLNSVTGRNFIVRLLHRYERGTRELSSGLVEQDYTGGIQAMQGAWNHWLSQAGTPRIILEN